MMVAGIVAEFNPFHRGHAYLIEATRERLGADTAIVCAMSGSFVQRGECAAFRKQARAEAAVRCGADLVLELPLPWSLSSAEGFAGGGVGLLAATGVVTHLCFGSESGDIDALRGAAEALERPETEERLRAALDEGMSYAAARQRALEAVAGCGEVIAAPNNILAVEYLKALGRLGSRIEPFTARRVGAGHDETGDGAILSASDIRRRVAAGENIAAYVPHAAAVFRREIDAGRAPCTMEKLETALLARLRMLPREAFDALPDGGEGLGRRLYTAVHQCAGVEDILRAAKSKRYAMSRIRRLLLAAALGLRAEDKALGVPYIKVLALSPRGRELLREMRARASLPVLTKPAAVRELDERARRVFALEADAADFCALAYRERADHVPGGDWRSTPFVLERSTGGIP